MRGKVNQFRTEAESYSFREESKSGNRRLDLNDLLKRAKEEKSNEKKNNLLIISGAASIVLVIFIVLSL